MTRKLALVVLLSGTALVGGTTSAEARSLASNHASCIQIHPGAGRFCRAVMHRKAIRVVRKLEVREVHRTHANIRISHQLGWNVAKLWRANHWERGRLRHLRTLPSWLPQDNVGLAQFLAAKRGWTGYEWTTLYQLWNRESGFKTHDPNNLGCDGIPQACPASKMGPGWEGNAYQQIEWGLDYIESNYGRPSAAWAHSQSTCSTSSGCWY